MMQIISRTRPVLPPGLASLPRTHANSNAISNDCPVLALVLGVVIAAGILVTGAMNASDIDACMQRGNSRITCERAFQ